MKRRTLKNMNKMVKSLRRYKYDGEEMIDITEMSVEDIREMIALEIHFKEAV